MKQYLDLLKNVLDNGTWQNNRTGIRTKMIDGVMIKFNLREGFPAVTTKKLAYRSVVEELLGFLRGVNTAKEFNEHGCRVWDANANAGAWKNNPVCKNWEQAFGNQEAGYLGRIYGVQWRDWKTSYMVIGDNSEARLGSFDQIAWLLNQIRTNPTSRRLIVSAWRPDELDQMALPPCHYSFQVIIEQETKTMHLLWNQRSVDSFLGLPFNIASYATLLHTLAAMTGYNVGNLTGFLADVHIYENHLEQVQLQLSRTPYSPPKLHVNTAVGQATLDTLYTISSEQFTLVGYECHPSIAAPMAV